MPDEMPDDAVNVSSEKGKQIIKYAMGSEYTVLEFSVLDNGDFVVADVTDHLKQLEKMHANNDPSTAMDMRVPEE